jgi:hypothetical protein
VRLEYFIACESVSVDTDTNRLSILNVLEEFGTAAFPFRIRELIAAAGWLVGPDDVGKDFQVVLRISMPGSETREFPVSFSVQAGMRRHRLNLRILGIEALQKGEAHLELLLNAKHQASYTFTVREATAQEIAKSNVNKANGG